MMLHYTFTGFMIASGIMLLVCWGAYRLWLQGKVAPRVSRLAILSIYLLMPVVPAIVALVPISTDAGIEMAAGQWEFYDVEGGEAVNESLNFFEVASVWLSVYLAGVALLFVMTCVNVMRLIKLRHSSYKDEINGLPVYVHTDRRLSSFSWLSQVYVYASAVQSPSDREMLVTHERAHVEMYHWVDLLVAQAVVMFQWFNPAAWLLRKELQEVHEYQADAKVLEKGIDEEGYQLLLIKNISRSRFTGLTDGLNNCSLKQRIIMMQKQKSNYNALWRGCGVAAIAVIAGIGLHTPAVASVTGEIEATQIAQKKSTVLIKTDSQGTATTVDIDNTTWLINGVKVSHDKVTSLNPDDIQSITINKENDPRVEVTLKPTAGGVGDTEVLEEIMVVSYAPSGNTGSHEASEPKKSSMTVRQSSGSPRTIAVDGNEVELKEVDGAYNVSDEMPQYPGGLSQLMSDLAMRVKYPASENREGVNARVVLQFIVNTEGHITNLKVIRPQGEAFDNAAISAVKSLNATWKPGKIDGKPVNVWFTLPITFQTKGVNNTSVNASIGSIAI